MKKENTEMNFTTPVDNDSSLGLEKNSLAKKFFNVFFVPILNNLPKGFKHKIKKTNNSCMLSPSAHNVIYNYLNLPCVGIPGVRCPYFNNARHRHGYPRGVSFMRISKY
jgi:hypothetical protein